MLRSQASVTIGHMQDPILKCPGPFFFVWMLCLMAGKIHPRLAAYTYTYIHIYIYTYIHIYIYTYTYTYVCVYMTPKMFGYELMKDILGFMGNGQPLVV